MPLKLVAADLFCGVGGLSRGLEAAGFLVRAGWDIDPACAYPYEANGAAKFHLCDVRDISASDVAAEFEGADIRLLAGCAPCQTFSTYTRGSRQASPSDERWSLMTEFARLVDEVLPELVTMENVPRAALYAPYRDFVLKLSKLGYAVHHEVVDCTEIGLPQSRRRQVLLASRIGPAPRIERKAQRVTVRQAIGDLPPVEHGRSHPLDDLHRASLLTERNVQRLRCTPEGGDWRHWPHELLLDCHKRKSGKTYRDVYGRMRWDAPSPTLTTLCCGIGNGRFGHPEQDRAITLREAGILQGFPPDYKFRPDGQRLRPRVIARLIGNAVPPPLGAAIGEALVRSICGGNLPEALAPLR